MRLPWQRPSADDDDAISTFVQITEAEALGDLLGSSDPTVLLIHDPWCPISAQAYAQAKRVGSSVHIVLSDTGRDLTHQIEAATGVRHESPQAMVLSDGRVHWHASHFAVTRDAIRAALRAAQGEA